MALSLVADANVEGHLNYLINRIAAGEYGEYWDLLGVRVIDLADLGLGPESPDVEVWRACQREQAVLITANRNRDGEDSLDATIRREGDLTSLPVLTLGDPDRLRHSPEYADRVIARLVLIMDEIEAHRGAGRLYLP